MHKLGCSDHSFQIGFTGNNFLSENHVSSIFLIVILRSGLLIFFILFKTFTYALHSRPQYSCCFWYLSVPFGKVSAHLKLQSYQLIYSQKIFLACSQLRLTTYLKTIRWTKWTKLLHKTIEPTTSYSLLWNAFKTSLQEYFCYW